MPTRIEQPEPEGLALGTCIRVNAHGCLWVADALQACDGRCTPRLADVIVVVVGCALTGLRPCLCAMHKRSPKGTDETSHRQR
jgi:hypothetical protein